MILEYVAFDEPLKESKNIRLVSKFWRDLSFKALLGSTQKRVLSTSQQKSIFQFNSLFPHSCPFPLELKIKQMHSADTLSILQQGVGITKIDIKITKTLTDWSTANASKMTFDLVHLRQITVELNSIPKSEVDLPQCWTFLDKLTQYSKSLRSFKLKLKLDSYLPLGQSLPPKLTHIEVKQCSNIAQWNDFLQIDLQNLTNFSITTYDPTKIELETIKSVLDTLDPKMESSLSISSIRTAPAQRHVEVPLLQNLKMLQVVLPLDTRFPLASRAPNLTKLSIDFLNLCKLLVKGSYFDNLKSLKVNGEKGSGAGANFKVLVKTCGGLPFPNLESLKWECFPPKMSAVTLPKMLAHLTNLKHLSISALLSDPTSGSTLAAMLTGLMEKEIPKTEGPWKWDLTGRNEGITSLPELQSFTLHNEALLRECEVGWFLFKLVFSEIPNLTLLRFSGNVSVSYLFC